VIILDLYKEIEQEVKKEGREYALIYYVKEVQLSIFLLSGYKKHFY